MKVCTKCKKIKNESCFYKHKRCKGGINSYCKDCHKTAVKNHRDKPDSKKRLAAYKRKKHYGITLEQYEQMLELQTGVCAICHRPEVAKNKWGYKRLAVDHNHQTGKVRGLLCNNCNNGLGRMKDSKEILLQAALYLEQHSD